ncbi:MAG: YdcF family protein [Rhodospirillales bacterium]
MAALLRLGAAAAVLGLLYRGGLVWFAATIPREGPVDARATDAIVVLTGGQLRLREGLRLMAEGKAKKLLVSGVNRNVELQELLRVARQGPGALECCVELGYDADSTQGNAREAAAFVAREKIASLRLVTANYHLRRATLEFRRAMPDIDLVAQPVYPENFHIDEWWRWPGTYALLQAEYHKYLGALLRPYLAFADANP